MNPELLDFKSYIYNYDYNTVIKFNSSNSNEVAYAQVVKLQPIKVRTTVHNVDSEILPLSGKLVWCGAWDDTVCYKGHDVVLWRTKFWACCTNSVSSLQVKSLVFGLNWPLRRSQTY